jgi:hypothetical protein
VTEEFQCPYADKGKKRCPEWRCDCFIDLYPDDPFGLHPEAFVVGRPKENER